MEITPAESRRLKNASRLALGRGILVIGFGLLLFIQPEQTRQFLANFMGVFWLAEGILTLRLVLSRRPVRRLGLYAGITAIVFGVLMVTSGLSLKWLPDDLVFGITGAIMVLTGFLHLLGGFRSDDQSREAAVGRILLGFSQMILGLLIIDSRSEFSPAAYLAMSVWAFMSGLFLILQGLRLRALARESGMPA